MYIVELIFDQLKYIRHRQRYIVGLKFTGSGACGAIKSTQCTIRQYNY